MEIRSKRIVYDESGKPIYVFIDYDEWLILEPIIESLPEPEDVSAGE